MSAPVPPQHADQVVYDFRGATAEARGFKAKRKREVNELDEQVGLVAIVPVGYPV